MPLLERLNEHSTGQPWVTWHCFTGTPAMPGSSAPRGLDTCSKGWLSLGAADVHPQPHTGQRISVITFGLAQLLASVSGCQHEPHWRHRQFGEKSQLTHLECKRSNLEVCMEPPSPPLWKPKKILRKTTHRYQNKEQELESAACTFIPLFTCLSWCPTQTHLLTHP